MEKISHIWNEIQRNLFPYLGEVLDSMTVKQMRLIEILEVVGIEDYVSSYSKKTGRPLSDRKAIARSFVCKAFYNMTTTVELIERLGGCKNLRRICGYERRQDVPDESTFSRAFAEFSKDTLSERVHEKLIEVHRGDTLVGHINRDSTEILAREKTLVKVKIKKEPRKRGRPKTGEEVVKKETFLESQVRMTLEQMLGVLPKACDHGVKKNSKGFTHAWNGYKLHIDTADGEIPISCILTSASVHDSQVALALAKMSELRVTSLYDVMDAAYDAKVIDDESRKMGHIPIIDSNPRGGEKKQMDPAKAQRYKIRTTSERCNGRFKDEFGGRFLRVKGAEKVMCHLMFGILALTADQLLRLVT